MIKSKCVYSKPNPEDGTRILVTSEWPEEVSWEDNKIFSWNRNVAPGYDLKSEWESNKISWDEYEYYYIEEMEFEDDNIRILAERSARGEVITLLCCDKEDDPHCHRHILKALIDEYNI